jgi:hypothetical protein
MMARFFRLAAFPLLATLAACSSSSSGDNPPGTSQSGGSGNGANGAGADSSSSGATGNSGAPSGTGASDNAGGTANDGNTGGAGNPTGGTGTDTGGASTTGTGGAATSTGGAGGMEACTETSAEAQSAPPILEILVDNTNSMSNTAPSTGGLTKMAATRQALVAAFPTMPAEYAVGMTYYHVNTGPCNDGVQAVPIAPMDTAQENALINSINTQAQIQMTPSEDAWRFAATYVQGFTGLPANYATSKRYVVVLTDGVPTTAQNCANSAGCNQGVSVAQYQTYIDAVAGAYANGMQTFVIGVPGSEDTSQVTCNGVLQYDPRSMLSQVATSGGTAQAGCNDAGPNYCHIDLTNPNINFVTELTRVIGAITNTVATCEYTVPTVSDPALVIDLSKVEVRYYPGGVEPYRTLSRSDGCVATGGWQYTDASQTHIMLCPDACDTVQGDTASRVEVYFGCLKRQ